MLPIKNSKIFTFVLVVLLSSSCRSDNIFDSKYIRVERPRSIALPCEIIPCDVPGAVHGFVVDSFYVFYTMLHPEHRFAVYDRRTMAPLTNLVRVGRGPNEYNYLTPGQRTCNDEGSGFWFYSGSKQESARLNLTKSITEDKVCIDSRLSLTELDIPGNVGSPGQLFAFDRINDTLALYQIIRGTYVSGGIYDFQKRIEIQRFKLSIQSNKEPNLTGGPIAISPDLTRMVMLPVYFDQINICYVDGSDRKSISTCSKPLSLTQIESKAPETRPMYYIDVETTNERIVALYQNHQTGLTEIHLFDWVGDLQTILTTANPIRSISLDTQAGFLYGFISSEEICKMDINTWLQ